MQHRSIDTIKGTKDSSVKFVKKIVTIRPDSEEEIKKSNLH